MWLGTILKKNKIKNIIMILYNRIANKQIQNSPEKLKVNFIKMNIKLERRR